MSTDGNDVSTTETELPAPSPEDAVPVEADEVTGVDADPTDAPELGRSMFRGVAVSSAALAAIQALVAVVAVGVLIVAPDDVSHLLARVVGVAMIATGFGSGLRELASERTSNLRLAAMLAMAVAGGLLVADPERFLTPVGRVAGAAMVVVGVALAVDAVRRATRDWSQMRVGMVFAVAGSFVLAFAETLFETVAVVAVILMAATAVVRSGARIGMVGIDLSEKTRRPILLRWIDQKGKTTQRRDDIYEQVFFEGPEAPARIGRFFLMMLFASVISAAGVLSDSTAVVIGAMLVAPLISPMMGMGLSLATGWPNRLARSTVIVLGGIVIAVGTGWLMSATGLTVDVVANSQIVSRSSPRIVDLVIAVAAGAAGAYAISRKDASSSLPGVAVAIALVPPLSVVGITAEAQDWQQAAGTLLLFLTNLVAIILAGGVVFVLTGVVPLRRFAANQHRVRTSLGAVAALALLVVGGLVINGRQITQDSFDLEEAGDIVAVWLGDDSEFEVVSLTVDDGAVAVVLAGPGDPPDAQALVSDLDDVLAGDVRLDLQWIPRQRIVVSADD